MKDGPVEDWPKLLPAARFLAERIWPAPKTVVREGPPPASPFEIAEGIQDMLAKS